MGFERKNLHIALRIESMAQLKKISLQTRLEQFFDERETVERPICGVGKLKADLTIFLPELTQL